MLGEQGLGSRGGAEGAEGWCLSGASVGGFAKGVETWASECCQSGVAQSQSFSGDPQLLVSRRSLTNCFSANVVPVADRHVSGG